MEVDKELKEQMDALPEINVYFLIKEMGLYLYNTHKDYKEGRIPEKRFQEIQKGFPRLQNALEYGTRSLTRFGVSPTHEVAGRASAEYWAWFQWWEIYVKNLPEEKWKQLETAILRKEDVSRFRPPGTWRANVGAIRAKQLEEAIKISELTKPK